MIKAVCFTGHRPSSFSFGYNEKSNDFLRINERICSAVSELCADGYNRFYTGMAEGADIWAAESVIRESVWHKDIELIAAIPYPGQRNAMNENFQKRYDQILKCCTNIVYTSKAYTQDCFKIRNYYMVENSNAVIAVYDPNKWRSGTGQTVRYAEKLRRRIIHINPNAR